MTQTKSSESRNAYVELCEANRRFYEYAMSRPEGTRRETFAPVHVDDGMVRYPMQSWPTFIRRDLMDELGAVAVEVCRLNTTVPERIFDNDTERLRAVFGELNSDTELAYASLSDPAALARVIGRGDFLDTPNGLSCVEFNLMAGLGGWEIILLAPRYLRTPFIAEFLAREGISPTFRDTFVEFMDHAVRHARKDGLVEDGELNLLVLIEYTEEEKVGVAKIRQFLGARMAAYFAERGDGLTGRADIARFGDLEIRDGGIYCGDLKAHVVARRTVGDLPPEVAEAFLQGDAGAHLYQPYGEILSDKRNLAYLSAAAEGDRADRYSAEEHAFIARHIPWTRLLRPGKVRYRGEEVELMDLLAGSARRDLVIKPGRGAGGRGVNLGNEVSGDEWQAALDEAREEGHWIVQERIEPIPYVYQRGEEGAVEHALSWGLFVFGDRYTGNYLRMSPLGTTGVLNITRGAESGYALEVEE